jgi:hypothetical protein
MRRFALLPLVLVAGELAAQNPRVEVRAGASILSTNRTVFLGGASGKDQGTLSSFEFLARGDGNGVRVRLARGGFDGGLASGDLRQGDAMVMIGAQVFHVIAGYGRRARGTSLTENFVGYGRAGAGTAIGLGSSGIMLEVAGGALFGARSNLSDIASVGREGEVSVFYQLPRGLPLFAQLGYRYQWFKNRDLGTLGRGAAQG